MQRIDVESVRSARSMRSNRSHRSQSSARSQPMGMLAANNMPPYGVGAGNGTAYRFASPYNYAPVPPVAPTVSSPYQRGGQRVHAEYGMQGAMAYPAVVPMDFDENWADNNTAITGATSETGASVMNEELMSVPMNVHARAQARYLSTAGKEQLPMEYTAEAMESGCDCAHTLSLGASFVLALLALASPITMIVLPKCGLNGWQTAACGVRCEAPLVSFAFKLLILVIGSWALFVRRTRCSLPRLRLFRALVCFLLLMLTFAFWLYYAIRILDKRESDFGVVLDFAGSFVDALICVHYLAVVLIEVRALANQFAIKVVRSPDGAARIYPIGALSIQHAAVHVLDRYAVDFEQHNPFVDAAIRRHAMLNAGGASASGSRAARRAHAAAGDVEYKFYEIDGVTNANTNANAMVGQLAPQSMFPQFAQNASLDPNAPAPQQPQNPGQSSEPSSFVPASNLSQQNAVASSLAAQQAGRMQFQAQNVQDPNAFFANPHAAQDPNGPQPQQTASNRYRRRMDRDVMRNDRFYAELEYERRLRRRRARLVSSVEDAFAHIKKISIERGMSAAPLEPTEAAQAVFPSIARPLQKYLRVTRQQLKYSMETIVAHLALCLTYELGPRVFLERFLAQGAVLQNEPRAAANGRSSARQTWTILTDTSMLNRAVDDGTVFILKQHDVALLCTVHKLPFFTLSEEILDAKSNKFVLKLNSETSV